MKGRSCLESGYSLGVNFTDAYSSSRPTAASQDVAVSFLNQYFCAEGCILGKPALRRHLRTRYKYTGQDTATITTAYTAVSLSTNA